MLLSWRGFAWIPRNGRIAAAMVFSLLAHVFLLLDGQAPVWRTPRVTHRAAVSLQARLVTAPALFAQRSVTPAAVASVQAAAPPAPVQPAIQPPAPSALSMPSPLPVTPGPARPASPATEPERTGPRPSLPAPDAASAEGNRVLSLRYGITVREIVPSARPLPEGTENYADYAMASQLDEQPQAVELALPDLAGPDFTKLVAEKRRATVTVVLLVDESGAVVNVLPVFTSEGMDAYFASIAEVLRTSRFTPGMQHGKAVKSMIFRSLYFGEREVEEDVSPPK